MAILNFIKKPLSKQIKASSLVETLVATVLIVLLFAIASLTLNNILRNSIKNNTDEIHTELNYLDYLYTYNQINLPFYDTFKDWEIHIYNEQLLEENTVFFNATHTVYNTSIKKIKIHHAK